MNWLNNFNSTNGKIFAGITMAHIVVITVCWMEAAGKHFNEILLLELLAFIAAWAGIAYAQFAKKRDTFKPAYPADEDGPTPPKPPAIPEPVMAMRTANAAQLAGPATPVGEFVAGEGD